MKQDKQLLIISSKSDWSAIYWRNGQTAAIKANKCYTYIFFQFDYFKYLYQVLESWTYVILSHLQLIVSLFWPFPEFSRNWKENIRFFFQFNYPFQRFISSIGNIEVHCSLSSTVDSIWLSLWTRYNSINQQRCACLLSNFVHRWRWCRASFVFLQLSLLFITR